MPLEIERKFLVAHDGWKKSMIGSIRIHDGLVALYNNRKVRVRISDDTATITIKGPRRGITRAEFEYPIPLADAEQILLTLCPDDTLTKRRFFVRDSGSTWCVDVYEGILEGVVIAEIELTRESQEFTRPDWIGKEVTGDPRYRKSSLIAQRREADAAVHAAALQD